MYQARIVFWRLRQQGIVCDLLHPRLRFYWPEKPLLPWHPIWGHCWLLSKLLRDLPRGVSATSLEVEFRRLYPELGPVCYLDFWPLTIPLMMISSPIMARQLLHQMPVKPDSTARFMQSRITGGHELLTMEGPMWKYWRSTFAHGFGSSHIMTVVPELIEEALVFRDILREKAKEGVRFPLESITSNLAADLVGRFML